MLTGCRRRRALDQWARGGCYAELDLDLLHHVRACRTCWQFYTEVTSARRIVANAPVHLVSKSRLASIEVLLRAETQRPFQRPTPIRRRRPWQWLAVAAIGVLAGTAGVAAVRVGEKWRPSAPPSPSPQMLPAVIVGLAAGAKGHSVGDLPDAPYELEDGQGEFDVGKISGGRSFRVLAGKHVVDARNSHFRLTVVHAELSRVEVTSGRVTVRAGGETVAALGAGQSYTIAEPPSPRAVGSIASTQSTPARAGAEAPDDSSFAEAFRLLNAGLPERAAAAFDAQLGSGQLDASRRADVLYWSSQAHSRAGNNALAEARALSYLSAYPSSLRIGDVALMLGDYARARGATPAARSYYEQAARAGRPATQARALEKLRTLDPR